MSKDNIKALEDIVNKHTEGMANITSKKMFGCHAVWVKDNVFALVWKHGRFGVKLPVEQRYDTLMSVKGSEPWKAGPMKMAHWVLVPEKFHSDQTEFKKWIKKANDDCALLKKEKKKPAPKAKKGKK